MKKALQRSRTFDGDLVKIEKRLPRSATHSSFNHVAEFDYKRDVKHLVKILKQCITAHILDLDSILHFLSSYNCEQRMLLIHDLEYEYHYNLVDMVLEQPQSPIRSCTLAMLVEPLELAVRDFHDILTRKLTAKIDSDVSHLLLEILLGLSNDDAQKFKETYEQLFVNPVHKDIELVQGEKTMISNLLIQLLEGQRNPEYATSFTSAKSVSKRLRENTPDTPTIDDDFMIKVFTRESFPQLASIFDIYEDKYKESIHQAIKRQFQDPAEVQCFEDIIDFLRLPGGYYSRLLRQALDKTPTDFVTLARVIIGHEETDLAEIKLEYSKIHNETLDSTIIQRVENIEIKRVFVMIITGGKDITANEGGSVRFDHVNNSHSSAATPGSTSPSGASATNRRFSHDAFEKVVNIFKMMRSH